MTSRKSKRVDFDLAIEPEDKKAAQREMAEPSSDQPTAEDVSRSASGFAAFMQTHMTEFMVSIAIHSVAMFLLILMSSGIEDERPEVTVIQKIIEEEPDPPHPSRKSRKSKSTTCSTRW